MTDKIFLIGYGFYCLYIIYLHLMSMNLLFISSSCDVIFAKYITVAS